MGLTCCSLQEFEGLSAVDADVLVDRRVWVSSSQSISSKSVGSSCVETGLPAADAEVDNIKLASTAQKKSADAACQEGEHRLEVVGDDDSLLPGSLSSCPSRCSTGIDVKCKCQAAHDARVDRVVKSAARGLPNGLDGFLRNWCTAKVVSIYIDAANGDEVQASNLLLAALLWRAQNVAVLTGDRVPRWQGDMRIVARAPSGHPMIMMSFRHQPSTVNVRNCVDHTIAVLEAAVTSMASDADKFDVVCDCRGFQLFKNLDPRPTIASMEMLRHAYRGRLRCGFLVEAPFAFHILWRIACKVLPQSTQNKIRFVTKDEAVAAVEHLSGSTAAAVVERALAAASDGKQVWKRPSELELVSQDDTSCV